MTINVAINAAVHILLPKTIVIMKLHMIIIFYFFNGCYVMMLCVKINKKMLITKKNYI